jgi:hypothetical protein
MSVDQATTIARIRENLGEAKRYLKGSPSVAREMVEQSIADLDGIFLPGVSRLTANLEAGLRWDLAAPDVLRGYLDAACFELLNLQEKTS